MGVTMKRMRDVFTLQLDEADSLNWTVETDRIDLFYKHEGEELLRQCTLATLSLDGNWTEDSLRTGIIDLKYVHVLSEGVELDNQLRDLSTFMDVSWNFSDDTCLSLL